MKKILLSFVMPLIVLIGFFTVDPTVKADEDTTTIEFSQVALTLDEYHLQDVTITYHLDGFTEVATITDRQTGQVLETVTFEPDLTRSVERAIYLTRTASFGRTTVQLSILVGYYQYGSFRQINSVRSYSIHITNAVAPTEIENGNVSVWSPTGYPTTTLHYGFNGNLLAKINWGASANLKAELLNTGFNFTGNANQTSFYRRPFHSSGTISLY